MGTGSALAGAHHAIRSTVSSSLEEGSQCRVHKSLQIVRTALREALRGSLRFKAAVADPAALSATMSALSARSHERPLQMALDEHQPVLPVEELTADDIRG